MFRYTSYPFVKWSVMKHNRMKGSHLDSVVGCVLHWTQMGDIKRKRVLNQTGRLAGTKKLGYPKLKTLAAKC